jgi:hypothetical protein
MGNVSSTSPSPNPGLIAQVPVDFNNLSGENAKALDTLRSWTATPSGKVELRFKQIDPATGLKVYEAKGGKSTVTIRATGFAEAAQQADKLVAAKALAPRSAIWSDLRADPKARFNLPKKSSFLGASPGTPTTAPTAKPRAIKTNTPQVTSSSGGSSGKPTKEARANLMPLTPKLSDPSSGYPAVRARNPLMLGDGNSTQLGKYVSPFPQCAADSTAAPAKAPNDPNAKKALPNPRAVALYSVSGAVASYNVNVATGMSPRKALDLIPAGIARDVIQVGISQASPGNMHPMFEWAFKAGVGGTLTYLSNKGAAKYYKADAYPERSIHAGMVAAAVTVNGSIIGLKELQKNGYLGGLPPDNPKGLKQWLHKYGGESAAIGLGVGTAMTPAVFAQQLIKKSGGGVFDRGAILRTAFLGTTLPALQNLTARALTSPICPAVPDATKNQYSPAKTATDVGTYVAGDAIAKKVLSSPITKMGTVSSLGWGLYISAMTEGLTLLGTNHNLNQYTAANLKNIDTAREALTDIHTLLTHPASGLLGVANPNGGNEAYIDSLKEFREALYQLHPTLRPSSK